MRLILSPALHFRLFIPLQTQHQPVLLPQDDYRPLHLKHGNPIPHFAVLPACETRPR